MSNPKVLIVGCGAVGLIQGYYLSSGADITYLVRPGRKAAFTGPKHLYSYKDDELYTFSSYRVVESPSEISGEAFIFVLDTLDGNTARSEGGVATITAVGDLLNETQNQDAFVVYSAIGLDMDQHYARTLRIPTTRLILCMSMFAHQPTPTISLPSTADKSKTAQADLFFACMDPKTGLTIVNTQSALVERVRTVYASNRQLTVKSIPAFIAPSFIPLAMLHLVTWNTADWPPFPEFRANTELWNLMITAQTEILTLPRSGWTGWLLSFVMKSWAAEKINLSLVEIAKPMRFEEFNAFHHGGKVVKQDIRTLEDVLKDGEQAGKKMPALRKIVRRAVEVEDKKAGRA
ncbi:hypothetical protein NX059_011076 [Plenodomus lindquistii]|nr:hypothetical protein NX059_011076 [Plenodomus lindquistii]